MVTTTGQPEHRQWGSENWHHPTANPWALEAITQRGYTDWDTPAQDLGDDPILTHSQELERDGEAPPRVRSERTEAAARTVIADALGVDVTELDADIDLSGLNDIVSHDLTDTRAALDALDRALADPRRPEAPKAAPGSPTAPTRPVRATGASGTTCRAGRRSPAPAAPLKVAVRRT